MAFQAGKITKAFAKTLMSDRNLITDPTAATHFICLPLCNDATRLGLENMVRTLKNDSYLSKLPQKAFRLPRAHHLPIVRLKASSMDDTLAILNAFQQLNASELLSEEPQDNHENNAFVDRNALACVGMSEPTGVAGRIVPLKPVMPLTLTLRGLRGMEPRNSVGEGFLSLYTGLECPDRRLRDFDNRIGPQFGSRWIYHPVTDAYSN